MGSRSEFSFTEDAWEKNVITFGADMSSSLHIDKKNKDILIFDVGPSQGLSDTTLTAKSKHLINFKESRKRFVLNLHYNGKQ